MRIKPEYRPTIDDFIIEISKIRTLYDGTFKFVPVIYPPRATRIASEQKVASMASEQKTVEELLAEWDDLNQSGGFYAKYVYNKIHYMKL